MGRVESTVAVPVERAQLIDAGAFRFDTSGAQAIGQIGGVLQELGKRKVEMQDRLGISDANAAMENAEREAAIELIDTPFDKRQEVRLKHINKAKSTISGIKLSAEASKIAQNRAGIWGDTIGDMGNIADIQLLSKATDQAVSQDFQSAMADFEAGSPELIEAEEAFDSQFANRPPQEAKAIKDSIVGQTMIFKATNEAADNPTPENLKEARDIINKHSTDEKDRFFNLQRLRSESSKRTQNKNETFKANLNLQSQTIGQSFSQGELFQGEVVPELEVSKSQLTERFTNGTLDVSDGVTSDSFINKINKGEFFDEDELTSAYATGMSSTEYQEIVKLNKENEKLTLNQKDDLNTFSIDVDERYRNILSTARAIATPNTSPAMFTAIGKDKKALKTEVRKMVRNGKPEEEIYEIIESNFIADTDRFYVRFWSTDFGLPEVQKEIGDREERFESVMDLLKTGEKQDTKQLQKLLEFWYK